MECRWIAGPIPRLLCRPCSSGTCASQAPQGADPSLGRARSRGRLLQQHMEERQARRRCHGTRWLCDPRTDRRIRGAVVMTDTWHGKKAPTGLKTYPAWRSDPTRSHYDTAFPADERGRFPWAGIAVFIISLGGVWIWLLWLSK